MNSITFPLWTLPWETWDVDVRGTKVRLLTVVPADDGSVAVHVTSDADYLEALEAGIRDRERAGEIDLATAEGGYISALPYTFFVTDVCSGLHRVITRAAQRPIAEAETRVARAAKLASRMLNDAGTLPLKPLRQRSPSEADPVYREWAKDVLNDIREHPPSRPSSSTRCRGGGGGSSWQGGRPEAGNVHGWGFGKMRAPRHRR